MMSRLQRGVLAAIRAAPSPRNATTVDTLVAAGYPASGVVSSERDTVAMKLSAVNRCIEVLSDSIAKLPIYIMDGRTRQRVQHPIVDLLTVRPNDAHPPSVAKKMVESNRLSGGNGYLWIIRSPGTMRPVQLIPVPHNLVTPWADKGGRLWYTITHPYTGTPTTVRQEDMIHVRAYMGSGYKGVSVLQRASEVIRAGRAAQQYNMHYYESGGQPAGVLSTDTHLEGDVDVTLPDGSTQRISKKDAIRAEWEKRHSGPTNAQRVAVLDYGLKYQPISVSNKDAQFVESTEISVQDIARFFGVPLYKLQAGKQSYSSNEQNSIEYVVSTLHPIVSQYEEELTYKLLTASEVAGGLQIRINMMAELRGDFASRGAWYRNMREVGAFCVNDILALEDLPDVDGGEDRYASLNYVPLADWRELSKNRNGGTTA